MATYTFMGAQMQDVYRLLKGSLRGFRVAGGPMPDFRVVDAGGRQVASVTASPMGIQLVTSDPALMSALESDLNRKPD